MITRVRVRVGLSALAVLLAGCKGHEFHPPDKEAQVAQADSLYAPALFDSIQWPSDSARVNVGNEVYAAKCDKCHGPLGEGGTEYAASQKLDVPSLVRPDWEYGNDHDKVRHRVFTGHPDGMPIWGVGNLTPREIDAVTAYVIGTLRASR
ncbi:MAG TPA: c-type cytochrome [Longimicrobiales bacterium]|nr:c-type cytochrome [Longimicrobiales bacterium]